MAAFEDFKRGDRLRFVTWRRRVAGYRSGMVWRTGTVDAVTPKSLVIICDDTTPSKRMATITRAEWDQRCVEKISNTPPPSA